MPMTPRERVLAAINHEEPDRVPIVMGVSNATSIKMPTYKRVKDLLGIDAPDEYFYEWPELGTAMLDEQTLQRLHSDVRGVWDREPAYILKAMAERDPHSAYINSWKGGAVEIEEGRWFPHIHYMPEATTIEDLEAYSDWPDMDDPTRVDHVAERTRMLAEQNEYAIMGTPWLLFPFERGVEAQGMDVLLLNMALYPDFTVALYQKIAELCKQLMGHFLRECGENIDIIKIGDDLGTQASLLMSPDMYRAQLKDVHADYIAFIKEHTHAKVFFHTDGDVFPLIDDFIEIGVDILNPIQTSAGKMSNLEELKKRYGKELVFCGGIDTHRVLPFGTPEDVRNEVKRVIDILGPGGGYMLASVHTVMDEVPAENVVAMCDAVEEFGVYPLKG